jgi:26S proteasome regulatory subunit N9
LVEIGLFVVKEMMTNPDDALAFIQSIQEKVKTDVESRVLCMVAIGDIKLKSLGAVDDVKALVEEGGELMDTIDGITSVHARYYDLCGEYNKVLVAMTTGGSCDLSSGQR